MERENHAGSCQAKRRRLKLLLDLNFKTLASNKKKTSMRWTWAICMMHSIMVCQGGLSIRKWSKCSHFKLSQKSESHQRSRSHFATHMMVLYGKWSNKLGAKWPSVKPKTRVRYSHTKKNGLWPVKDIICIQEIHPFFDKLYIIEFIAT